ncbi:MAG: LemA family protein [Proteobacteria bacterium]|jgi:LemA protein|nr:LemA family protein [Pseudomonadota bacterium]
MIVLYVLVALGILSIFFLISIYNRLVSLRNQYKNSFSQIDVQLKRRYDLIPNLVETARAYMRHEKETLESVIRARNMALTATKDIAGNPQNAQAMQQLMAAEGTLTGGLSRLLALAENYPDLKANQNMMQLTEELTSTENKISFARQAFNDSVMLYNTTAEVFPNNVIAGMFGFRAAQLFEVEDAKMKEAPRVAF